MVAVERFGHDRVANPGGDRARLVGGAHHVAPRHREPRRGQQRGRQLLVAGDVNAERGRPRRHRGTDPLLILPLAQLDEGLVVEPDVGDVAASGLVEDGLGRWSEGCPVGEQDEAFQLGNEIERRIGLHEVVQEANREPAARQAHLLLAVSVDDVVLSRGSRSPGLAPGGRAAGFALELQGDVLGHVSHPGAVAQPLDKPAGTVQRTTVIVKAGKQVDEDIGEVRQRVQGPVLERAEVHEQADRRLV